MTIYTPFVYVHFYADTRRVVDVLLVHLFCLLLLRLLYTSPNNNISLVYSILILSLSFNLFVRTNLFILNSLSSNPKLQFTMTPISIPNPLNASISAFDTHKPPSRPKTQSQWKSALQDVKSLYIQRQYKQCAARSSELLKNGSRPVTILSWFTY